MSAHGVVLVGGPLDGLELDTMPTGGRFRVPIYTDATAELSVNAWVNPQVVEPAALHDGRPYSWHLYRAELYRHRTPGFPVKMHYQPKETT